MSPKDSFALTKDVRSSFPASDKKGHSASYTGCSFRLRTALENTIPDLLRKCKRDILPLENVPKTNAHFFLHHRSLQDTRGSKGRIPFLIEERGITTK